MESRFGRRAYAFAASGKCILIELAHIQQLKVLPLLHTLTSSSHSSFSNDRGLNPTPGILNRLPEIPLAGVTFLRDPSHPRGGVLVATRQAAREIKDLPEGTVIIGGPLEDEEGVAAVTSNGGGSEVLLSSGMQPLGSATGRLGISTPDWEAVGALPRMKLPLTVSGHRRVHVHGFGWSRARICMNHFL
jgi:hypothetical protein